MVNIFYKLRALPRAKNLPRLMLIFSWPREKPMHWGNATKKPLHYYRFLDDIWGVWTHSEEEFTVFLHTLNHHNSSIQLKATLDSNSVNFLDTTTVKGPKFSLNNQLDIKLYFKETDTHAFLHKDSYHPQHQTTIAPSNFMHRMEPRSSSSPTGPQRPT